MRVFVDTSAFYALADEDDKNHPQAKAAYKDLLKNDQLITSDYILLESWFLISHHLGKDAALKFWDGLISGNIEMVDLDFLTRQRAREIINEYPDQSFSLVDATNFALMEKEEIEKVFTFEPNFWIYRFWEEVGDYLEGHFEVVPLDNKQE